MLATYEHHLVYVEASCGAYSRVFVLETCETLTVRNCDLHGVNE